MIILTQSQGTGRYSADIKSQTAVTIDVECFISQIKFVFLTGNYLLVHPDLISAKIIFGGNFYSNTACAGAVPSASCLKSHPFPLPISGARRIISYCHITVYRDDSMINAFSVDASITTVDQVNMDLYTSFGHAGSMIASNIVVVVIRDQFVDLKIKRHLQFQHFTSSGPQVTASPATRVNTLINNAFDYNFFVGLKIMLTTDLSSVMHFTIQPNSTNQILTTIYLAGSQAALRGFIFFGYKSPSTAFVFSDDSQLC